MFPLSDLSGRCIIFNEVNCVNLECDLLIFTAGEGGISNHQDKNWRIGEYWAQKETDLQKYSTETIKYFPKTDFLKTFK